MASPRFAHGSSTTSLGSNLNVQTQSNGNTVYYKISDDAKLNAPKTARYSQLASLHQQITQEVPAFRGVFPPKKLLSNRAKTIETRRAMIEEYLRVCINDTRVKDSKAFSDFLGSDWLEADDANNEFDSIVDLESNLDNLDLDSSIARTVNLKAQSVLITLDTIKDKEVTLEDQLTNGQSNIENVMVETEKLAANERQSVEKLRAHHSSIEELKRDMLSKKYSRAGMAKANELQCQRLKESLAVARECTKRSQESLVAVQSKRPQVVADNKAKLANASKEVSLANSAHAAAIEELSLTKKSLVILSEGLAARQLEARTAEIQREMCENALSLLQKELDEAEAGQKRASDMLNDAEAAKADFIKESAARKLSLEMELKWANERAAHADTLRDMYSRESLVEGDRQALEGVQKMMSLSAEAASKSSTEAAGKLEQTVAADAETLKALQADCDKLAKDLQVWEALCSQLISRHAQNEAELAALTSACAACDAAVQVLLDTHQPTKIRVDGPLKAAVEANAAKLKAAKQAVVDLKKSGSDALASARYAEDAEMVALKQAEAAEANLERMLNETTPLCAIPSEDDDTAAHNSSTQLISAKADQTAREEAATQAREASRLAADAVAAAEAQLESAEAELMLAESSFQAKSPFDEEDEDDQAQQIAALRSRLTDLKKEFSERRAEEQTAKTAADDAKAALEASESLVPSNTVPSTLSLLESEFAMLKQCVSAHDAKELSLMGDASKLAADWENRKIALEEELLRAKLQMKTGNTDFSTLETVKQLTPRGVQKAW